MNEPTETDQNDPSPWLELEWRDAMDAEQDPLPHLRHYLWLMVGLLAMYGGIAWLVLEAR